MPGRTPAEAREAFLAPLRCVLSCLTLAQLFVSAPAEVEALRLSEDRLRVTSAALSGDLHFRLRHQYRTVEDRDQPAASWHVSTVAYDYRLGRGDGSELVSWHWHPSTPFRAPHLHVATGAIGRRTHLPTGRVSVESVVRLLLTDLAVPSRRDDWPTVLDQAEGPFVRYRRWSLLGAGGQLMPNSSSCRRVSALSCAVGS